MRSRDDTRCSGGELRPLAETCSSLGVVGSVASIATSPFSRQFVLRAQGAIASCNSRPTMSIQEL